MYCSKCGKEIPEESVFCPECGNRCKLSADKENKEIDTKEIKELIINLIFSPINTMKNGNINLSSKNKIIYILITTLIMPLITVLFLRASSFNLIKSIPSTIAKFSGSSSWNINDSIEFKNQFNMIMQNLFPTGKLYVLSLSSYILNYALLLGIIYIVFKFIIKDNFGKTNILNILFIISTFNVLLKIISSIALILGLLPWLVLKLFSVILLIVLLYSLLNTFIESREKLIYVYPATLVIVSLINMKFIFSSVGFIISDIFLNNFLNFM
ncbi:zinc ribbon domain-containing protein [Clostridium perfringens]|uniref:zinc ribbon domain-containing protein n=1 Tax=Clostridium perfringens TaxID=1502 RepID=UPI001ABBB7C0|nr:zinc ribbon domain-containing protein [Clostridium perfringens]MBO3406671.1 zinc ribbon domain-containing protein [Clostridium perfringens]